MKNVVVEQIAAGLKSRDRAKSSSRAVVRLCVAVGEGVDRDLARAVKAELTPQVSTCRIFVSGFGGTHGSGIVHTMGDAAIVLAGADPAHAADLYRAYSHRGTPCLVLVALDGREESVAAGLVAREVEAECVVVCDAASTAPVLGEWLLGVLPQLENALGAGFDCCRDRLAMRTVGQTARNNAVLGAMTFLKGADTPAMMASEIAMVYKLASARSLELGRERAPEVAGVVAASLALKGLAKFAVKRLPLPAALVKAGVAAAGTYVTGALVDARQKSLVKGAHSGEGEL